MHDQGTSNHRPLRQTYSDSTNVTTIPKNQDMLFWKKTEEQLRLRRRLPQSDIQALLDAVGHRRLERIRSSSTRYREDKQEDDYRDPYGGYIPNQDSLKKRTLEPPRRTRDPSGRDTEYRDSGEEIVDLSDLFRSGSAHEKSWGKQMDMKK